MIQPKAECYFTITLVGDSASDIVKNISPKLQLDFQAVTIVSDEFSNDIECEQEFSAVFLDFKSLINFSVVHDVKVNPMYLPNTSLSESFEFIDDERVRFSEVDGNPFTIALHSISDAYDNLTIFGRIAFETYALPSLEDILKVKPCHLH